MISLADARVSPEDQARAMLALRRRQAAKDAAAAIKLDKPRIVSNRFGEWIAPAVPVLRGGPVTWNARHFVAMQALLDQVTAGTIRRVYFSIPIRHGKSEHNTIAYAAYRLELDPGTRILVISYNQAQANRFSRKIKALYEARGGKLSTTRTATEEWETFAGGGVMAVGAGGKIASVNADLIIIDDPIGSREDAESQAERDHVWDFITSDILARCEPHTAVLFTMSRWHKDDPAGRLMDRQKDRWTILDLPGEAEKPDPEKGIMPDPLGREPGEPLWPGVRDREWLEEKRAELGEYSYASLVMGRPRPRDGGMFKWSWWDNTLKEIPASGTMVRYWDLAGTKKKNAKHDPDFTAGALLCRMDDKRTAICDITRFQKSVHQRDLELQRIAIADLEEYGSRLVWWIEIEAGIMGEERTADLVKNLQALGLNVQSEHPTGSKTSRADPVAGAAEPGNVVLVEGKWNTDWKDEAADFPNGKHDDQVDGVSGAYAKLGKRTVIDFGRMAQDD